MKGGEIEDTLLTIKFNNMEGVNGLNSYVIKFICDSIKQILKLSSYTFRHDYAYSPVEYDKENNQFIVTSSCSELPLFIDQCKKNYENLKKELQSGNPKHSKHLEHLKIVFTGLPKLKKFEEDLNKQEQQQEQ